MRRRLLLQQDSRIKGNFLKFTAIQANSSCEYINNGTNNPDIKYSLNGADWVQWSANTAIALNTNDFIYVKGDNANGFSFSNNNYTRFNFAGKVSASGNINSLLDDDDGSSITELPSQYCFCRLFFGSSSERNPGLYNIENLVFQDITLSDYCYYSMFTRCNNLTGKLPIFQATQLAVSCYQSMFNSCTSITTLPSNMLPAILLAEKCYAYMFDVCSSIEEIPSDFLPATNLALSCYNYMFHKTTITEVPENLLPATTLVEGCYQNMFRECANLTTGPYLPATQLVANCYENMFALSSKVNYVKVNFNSWGTGNAYTNTWLLDASSTGTFICPSTLDTSIRNDSHVPRNWTIETFEPEE